MKLNQVLRKINLSQLQPYYMGTEPDLPSSTPSPELLQTPSGLWYTHRALLVSPLIRLTTQSQSSAEATHHFARLGFIIERHSPLIESLSDLNVLTLPTDPHLLMPQQSAGSYSSISSLEVLNNVLKDVERPLPIHYPHTNVPDHVERLRQEGHLGEGRPLQG